MKKFLLMIFTFLLSFPVLGEWTEINSNVSNGHQTTFYIDFDRLRKSKDGLIYYWEVSDYNPPSPGGMYSMLSYNEADCNKFRYRPLSASPYKKPMAKGKAYDSWESDGNEKWRYPKPNTAYETNLRKACAY